MLKSNGMRHSLSVVKVINLGFDNGGSGGFLKSPDVKELQLCHMLHV